MSKYIRTTYGIFEHNEKDELDGVIINDKHHVACCGNRLVSEDEVIRQADTLEELIDGYYVEIEGFNYDINHTFGTFNEAKEDYKDWFNYYHVRHEINFEITLHGFIKMDNGLIYVAKMNENGELELL